MKQLKKCVCTLLMLLVLSCGSIAILSCIIDPITAEAATIKLNKKKLTLNKGKSYQLKIKGTKKKVTWKSNKPSVAKVNSKGKVTAKKAGTAKITAKVNGKKYTCTVTVKVKKPNKPTTPQTDSPETNPPQTEPPETNPPQTEPPQTELQSPSNPTQPGIEKPPLPSEPEKENETQIRPEFKEAMDSYEAFFDEYVDFMKKYQESGSSISMLVDYANYLAKYADAMEKMNKLEEDDLTIAELAYYMEVTGRIMQKLSEVA